MYYVTLCAVVRDEGPFLKEWIDYHVAAGFEHVYLYDHASLRPVADTLAEQARAGLVTVTRLEAGPNRQLPAYARCLEEFGRNSEWMAFLDADEFLVPKDRDSIGEFLDEYRAFGGVAAHWVTFGSNGHITRPEGVLRSYPRRLALSRRDEHVKSVVRPAVTAAVRTPHSFAYKPGFFCVNEDGVPVLGHCSYHTSRRIQINHYYFRSQQDFAAKAERGPATIRLERGGGYDMAEFYEQAAAGEYADEAVRRFLPRFDAVAAMPPDAVQRLATTASARSEAESLRLAVELTGRDRLGLARQLLDVALRYEHGPALRIARGRLALREGRLEDALREAARALEEPSELRDEAYRLLAAVYGAQGRTDVREAIEAELRR